MAANGLKKILPLLDRVLIQMAQAPSTTASGVVIPEKARERITKGVVVAVGPGARKKNGELVPVTLQIGDQVLLPEFGGKKIVVDENKYYIYKESEIIAKFTQI